MGEQYTAFNSTDRAVEYALQNIYCKAGALSHYIRQAIIWKSLDRDMMKFHCNGDNAHYYAVWDRLPTITGLKPSGKVYSAMWGYDQTQITTATHYGRAFGLDVLITGGYSYQEVFLKRIGKDGRFSEGCMYFSPNDYSDDYITETNYRAMYYGR